MPIYLDFGLGVIIGIIWVYTGAVLPQRDYFFEFALTKFGIGGGWGGKATLFCEIIGKGGGIGVDRGIEIDLADTIFDISGAFIS